MEIFHFGIVVINVHDDHGISFVEFQNNNVRIVEMNENLGFFD